MPIWCQEITCWLGILPPVRRILYFFSKNDQVRREGIAFLALSPPKFEATYFALFQCSAPGKCTLDEFEDAES